MVSVSGQSKALSALRAATGAIHERMHQARPFAALAKGQLSITGYAGLLEKIATFHLTVRPGLDVDEARLALLARDLDALGSPMPCALPEVSPASAAAKLGWVYVVEGSALGGKVIFRQLDYLFGSSPEGRRFFRGSGSTSRRWRALCQELEVRGDQRDGLAELTRGAQQAFALFEEIVVRPCG